MLQYSGARYSLARHRSAGTKGEQSSFEQGVTEPMFAGGGHAENTSSFLSYSLAARLCFDLVVSVGDRLNPQSETRAPS